MVRACLIPVLIVFALTADSSASGLLGVFQGMIVRRPYPAHTTSRAKPQWMFVQSRNGSVRKVNIARAQVEYDDAVPVSQRHKNPLESLRLQTEVRITAEQDKTSDGSGDWQANNVLILAPKQSSKPSGRDSVAKKATLAPDSRASR